MEKAADLVLYETAYCPFCIRVRKAVKRLGIELERRNITAGKEHRRELIDATGRATVPVMRIEEEGGEVRWLPESADIIAYLEERFG